MNNVDVHSLSSGIYLIKVSIFTCIFIEDKRSIITFIMFRKYNIYKSSYIDYID
jgi:hypothetical protein